MGPDIRDYGTIGVLMGGTSSEREISLKSGKAIYNALMEEGCQAVPVYIDSEDRHLLLKQLEESGVDIAFIALHGHFGEDGMIQEILEHAHICYTGSASQASRLAFHKIECQRLFAKNGIQVPKFAVIKRHDPRSKPILEQLSFPVFVKPAREGSSIGISYVPEKNGLADALELAWRYDEEILIDQSIGGKELTVGVLDERTLPIVEIHPKNSYFDFCSKYEKGRTDYIVPAELSSDLTQRIQETALKAYRLLGCRHLGRVDLMLDQENRHFLLEVNTIPGFTATSLLPMAAGCAGIPFNQVCLKLVGLAHDEKKKTTNITHSC